MVQYYCNYILTIVIITNNNTNTVSYSATVALFRFTQSLNGRILLLFIDAIVSNAAVREIVTRTRSFALFHSFFTSIMSILAINSNT